MGHVTFKPAGVMVGEILIPIRVLAGGVMTSGIHTNRFNLLNGPLEGTWLNPAVYKWTLAAPHAWFEVTCFDEDGGMLEPLRVAIEGTMPREHTSNLAMLKRRLGRFTGTSKLIEASFRMREMMNADCDLQEEFKRLELEALVKSNRIAWHAEDMLRDWQAGKDRTDASTFC